jgi:excisionase family DNA binding protein
VSNPVIFSPAELDQLAEAIAEKLSAKMSNRPKYLDREAMAKELSVSAATVKRWCSRGVIPFIKADGGRVLFDPAQVYQALRNRPGGAA